MSSTKRYSGITIALHWLMLLLIVAIASAGGWRAADVRPLVRLNVSVVCADGTRMEAGGTGSGRRAAYGDIFLPSYWQKEADEAIRQSLVNLDSVDAPAGEMPVVLGAGWSGVLWHEAVGHGLEGDFHRKKTSVFSHLMGEMIASPGVTVVDDGSIANRRGSLSIDDEGTPTQETVLIEDGILLRKYWFSVSDEEQEARFHSRLGDPMRRWKLSPMDLQSITRWEDFSRAKDDMSGVRHVGIDETSVKRGHQYKIGRASCRERVSSPV
mgnify:CR=1 FL=1